MLSAYCKARRKGGQYYWGAGGYCLTLPVAKPDPLWVTMILDVTNTLSDASNAIPSSVTLVLLGVTIPEMCSALA